MEARAVAAAREILEANGGSMAAGTLFNRIFTVDARFKPVVGKARRFCERHGLAFVADGGAGTVALAGGDVDEADAVAAMCDLLGGNGGSMSAGPLISRLFTVDARFRPLVGKARHFCERHADVFVFTGGGDGTISLAQQRPARGAAARGVPGFMFMCSSATEGECLQRLLLGLQRKHLAKMQQIAPSTRLFLLNFQTRVVHGPFRTNRTAALDIVPEAWSGKFPAQLQVVGAGAGGSYESAALPTGDTQRQMGSMTSARADELVALLGGGPSPSPPVGGAQRPQQTTRREDSPAVRVATEFWAFLQANPSLLSHDRSELTDTYTAWRSDPSNWTEEPLGLSPAQLLTALTRKLKVISVKDGNVIAYTARARVGLSEASQDAARLASVRSADQRRERLGVPEAVPRATSQASRLRMDYDAVAARAVPYTFVDTVAATGDACQAIVAHIVSSGQAGDGRVIAVDLEWQSNSPAGEVSLIQIAAAPDQLYVFDVLTCPEIMSSALKALLEHSSITKVLHDCRNDESKLRDQFGFGLVNVFDTSAADTVLRDAEAYARRGLNAILHQHVSRSNPLKHHVDHTRWGERPLPAEMVSYAAQDVLYLVDAYYEMKCQLERAQLADLASRRTLDNLNDYKTPSTRTRQRFANDRMIEDTAQAFWDFMQQGDDQDPNSVKRECATRAGFKQHFEEWKSREQAAGHAWRGGAEAIRLKLIRNQMLEVHAVNVIIQQVGQTKSDSVKAAVQQVHQQRQAIEKDKGGISVATAAAFDSVVGVGQSQSAIFTLTNTGNHTRRLMAVSLTAVSGFEVAVNGVSAAILPIDVAPQQVVRVELTCSPRGVGVLRTILSLQFDCGRDLGPFTIGRFIEIRSSMNAELVEQLQPTAPYERKKKNRLVNRGERLIPGEGLPKDGLPEWPMRLKFADCPQDWKQILDLREADEWLAESQRTMTIHGYCDHWQRLLWTEERQQATDLQEFAMQHVRLTQNGLCFTLIVPGLAENRPSVLRGDKVKVRIAGDERRVWEGVAHLVQRDAVDLKFDRRFHASYIGQAVDVEFVLNRMTMRLFHQGCCLAAQLPAQTLFPQPLGTLAPRRAAPQRNPNNAMLNRQQLQAVHEIVAGVCRPTPYLLFGPPGTGKTVTLVESILQIYTRQPDSRILACAPTNTAADLLVERLYAALEGRHDMLRIMAFSRAREGDGAPGPKVLPFTLDDGQGSFRAPTLQEVLSHRIVVSTLTTASKLHNLGVQRGHFTTICVDEGGQSFEPEAIAPVAPLLGETGQLVVAGDPKQLGPIVHSPISADNGLAMSFLERLIARSVYAKDLVAHENTCGYDPRVLTKLVNNYRAHPALLTLPNELFYDNELVAAAEQTLTHSLCDWEHLPEKGVPLIFHGVHGKDEREANSPSWFNISEIEQVMQYVTWLLETRTNRLVAADIGIITPYAKQKQKLRTALGSRTAARVSFQGIKVGSTEEFQGQERRVIILTTVRTSRDFVESDVKHNLGFLVNPKRFNVAITRAQALMIVVGDPRVLHDDANWGELLRYSKKLGAYTGEDPPAATRGEDELDDLHSQMERLMQDDEEGEPSDDESDDEMAAAPSQRMQQEQLPFDRNE
jgi:hypothetical protein